MGGILALLATFLHIGFCLAGAPLLWGVVETLRAWMCGRRAPSLWQPYRHLIKLLGKTTLMPDTATVLFTIWPLVAFVALAVVVMLIPGFCNGMLTAGVSDYVTVIGLFAVARVAVMLAGLEAGSAFGGAASARVALFGLGAEATLLVLLLVFAFLAHSTNLDEIAMVFGADHASASIAMGFALVAMLMVAVVVLGYSPAGRPELTMINDAISLEYSGRHLALLDYTVMLRLLAWMNLLICLFVPFGMAHAFALLSWPGGFFLWVFKLLCLSLGLAIFDSARAEMHLFRRPKVLSVALFIGFLASLLLVVVEGGGV